MCGDVAMEKTLEDLRWKPMWVSHLGCIKGCLKYLNLDVSDAWLFGATGHAFIINVHESVCPSRPTAWNTEMLFKLGKNVGYVVDVVFSHKSKEEFALKQRFAWERTKEAIARALGNWIFLSFILSLAMMTKGTISLVQVVTQVKDRNRGRSLVILE